jgi:endo-1,4-beta-xylanase
VGGGPDPDTPAARNSTATVAAEPVRTMRSVRWPRGGRGWVVLGVVVVVAAAATVGAVLVSDDGGRPDRSAPTSPRTTTTKLPTTTMPATTTTAPPEPHRIAIGSAVDADALRSDSRYRSTLAAEFDMVTPENQMKWEWLHPARDTYAFSEADAVVDFAVAHRMRVRGHVLVWHEQLPSWVKRAADRHEDMAAILHDHIAAVVGRYRGRIAQWDVVNEAIDKRGHLRRTVWQRSLGDDYIAMAFRWAHEADPGARLYYNDYGGEGSGAKSDAIFRLVEQLKRDGVPIDGVGLQMHTDATDATPIGVAANMARLRGLGLDVAITEMAVPIPLDAGATRLRQQGDAYASFLRVCLAAPNCTAFAVWGYTDRYPMLAASVPDGEGNAALLDGEFRPKPAYDAVAGALGGVRPLARNPSVLRQ